MRHSAVGFLVTLTLSSGSAAPPAADVQPAGASLGG